MEMMCIAAFACLVPFMPVMREHVDAVVTVCMPFTPFMREHVDAVGST
jgi:hypothetical protein